MAVESGFKLPFGVSYIRLFFIRVASGKQTQLGVRKHRNRYSTLHCFDGAETCEFVGSYLLSKLTPKYGNDTGFTDDGLAAFNQTPKEMR